MKKYIQPESSNPEIPRKWRRTSCMYDHATPPSLRKWHPQTLKPDFPEKHTACHLPLRLAMPSKLNAPQHIRDADPETLHLRILFRNDMHAMDERERKRTIIARVDVGGVRPGKASRWRRVTGYRPGPLIAPTAITLLATATRTQ